VFPQIGRGRRKGGPGSLQKGTGTSDEIGGQDRLCEKRISEHRCENATPPEDELSSAVSENPLFEWKGSEHGSAPKTSLLSKTRGRGEFLR